MRSNLWILIALSLAACSDNTNAPAPITGTLRVSATTGGPGLDTDGYTLVLDPGGDAAKSEALPPTGTVDFNEVAAGQHTLQLSGVADNCTVNPAVSQSVTVVGGQTLTVGYSIVCSARPLQ
jgi:hypothetical protein